MSVKPDSFAFDTPDAAIAAVRQRLRTVDEETIDLARACGRVLAADLSADRDSPACDVSAMDGYAVRRSDLASGALEIVAEVRIGTAPPVMPPSGVVKIVTGAAVPKGADAVVRREDVDESNLAAIRLLPDARLPKPGENIRRRGENLGAGAGVVARGTRITPAVAAALAGFGVAQVPVYRPVRIGLLMTGDELLPAGARPTPWQIRDSNGPALEALFGGARWLEVMSVQRGGDQPELLRRQLCGLLDACDAVVTTGGVSMGDRDYVPGVAKELGGEVVFHKLPVRPGKPIFAAVAPGQKLVVGLPGNPVSALVGAVRMIAPLLRAMAGHCHVSPPPRVLLANSDEATLKLWWWRLARFDELGRARLVETRGSGDLVSAARSDGFIEVPPGASGAGPWAAYRWEV